MNGVGSDNEQYEFNSGWQRIYKKNDENKVIEDLNASINELKVALDELGKIQNSMKDSIKNIRKEINRLSSQLGNLQEELKKTCEENASVQNSCDSLFIEYEKLKNALREENKHSYGLLKELDIKITSVSEELEKFKNDRNGSQRGLGRRFWSK